MVISFAVAGETTIEAKPMETAETAVDIPPGNAEFGDLLVNIRYQLKITQEVGWFVSDADGFIVTLEVFSGVPDPQWMILRNNVNDSMFQKIKKGLDSAQNYDPENAPGKLGYEGFLVQEVKNGKKTIGSVDRGQENS